MYTGHAYNVSIQKWVIFILHSLHRLKCEVNKKGEKPTRTRGRIIPWQLRVGSGAYGDIKGKHEKTRGQYKTKSASSITQCFFKPTFWYIASTHWKCIGLTYGFIIAQAQYLNCLNHGICTRARETAMHGHYVIFKCYLKKFSKI